MAHASRPGTVTTQQLDRLRRAAEAAGVDGRWLAALAKSNRIKRRKSAGAESRKLGAFPMLVRLHELSMFEATDLITELEDAVAKGERVRDVCIRCVRIGFVGAVPCMHDGAGVSQEQMRVERFERERGRW